MLLTWSIHNEFELGKMRTINRIANIICIIVIAIMVILLVLNWNSLPDKVPTHFTFDGTADAFGSKSSLLREPIIAAALYLLITVAQHFPQIWNFPVQLTAENMEREYLMGSIMLNAVKVMMTILFLLTLLSALVSGFPAWPMMIGIAITLVVPIVGIVFMFKAR